MNFLFAVPLKADTQIMKDSFAGEKLLSLIEKPFLLAQMKDFESLKETPSAAAGAKALNRLIYNY